MYSTAVRTKLIKILVREDNVNFFRGPCTHRSSHERNIVSFRADGGRCSGAGLGRRVLEISFRQLHARQPLRSASPTKAGRARGRARCLLDSCALARSDATAPWLQNIVIPEIDILAAYGFDPLPEESELTRLAQPVSSGVSLQAPQRPARSYRTSCCCCVAVLLAAMFILLFPSDSSSNMML
jgi:hypothetical protein